MTAEGFHQVFDQLSTPVLLRCGQEWLLNTAAQTALSENDLHQLEEWDGKAYLWLSLQFYRVCPQQVDDQLMLILNQDTFLADAAENISSQLRQRLQSAFGCAADLSQLDAVRTDFQARERLSGLNRELYQLLRMAQELELSSQSTAIIYDPKYLDLVKHLIALADELKELFRPGEVELKLELPEALYLTADPKMLKYLIVSLISNSLVHLPQSGGQVTLGLKEQKGQAILTVSDNGSGFSSDLLSHPLWGEPRRLLFGRGLGLGLPLVQRFAAHHGGTVVASPKDSLVKVSIPIHVPDDRCTELFPPPPGHDSFSVAKVFLSNALPRSLYYPNPEGDGR